MEMAATIEQTVHFTRRGGNSARRMEVGEAPNPGTLGRIPRISRLMALAIRFDQLIREGHVSNYAELARIGQVTRTTITHVMNLLHLAPELQEQLLFLPRADHGNDPVYLKHVLPITRKCIWRIQRELWETCRIGQPATM